jgi:hypothetical protein
MLVHSCNFIKLRELWLGHRLPLLAQHFLFTRHFGMGALDLGGEGNYTAILDLTTTRAKRQLLALHPRLPVRAGDT